MRHPFAPSRARQIAYAAVLIVGIVVAIVAKVIG